MLICPKCGGSGFLVVANGEDDFDKELCEVCAGVGSLPDYENFTLETDCKKQ